MNIVEIHTETIRLDQALKLSGQVLSGAEAKFRVQEGEVEVNGEICQQRGKKLHPGDRVKMDGQEFEIRCREA